MRISDWSSDVCSSDLFQIQQYPRRCRCLRYNKDRRHCQNNAGWPDIKNTAWGYPNHPGNEPLESPAPYPRPLAGWPVHRRLHTVAGIPATKSTGWVCYSMIHHWTSYSAGYSLRKQGKRLLPPPRKGGIVIFPQDKIREFDKP